MYVHVGKTILANPHPTPLQKCQEFHPNALKCIGREYTSKYRSTKNAILENPNPTPLPKRPPIKHYKRTATEAGLN